MVDVKIMKSIIAAFLAFLQSMAFASLNSCQHRNYGEVIVKGFSPTLYELSEPCSNANGILVLLVLYASTDDMDYSSGKDLKDLGDYNKLGINDNRKTYRRIAEMLVGKGYRVLRHNPLGLTCKREVNDNNDSTNMVCTHTQQSFRVSRTHLAQLTESILKEARLRFPQVKHSPTIFVSHSAGSGVVSDYFLLPKSDDVPYGFVGLAPLLSTNDSSMYFRHVLYWVEQLKHCDRVDLSECLIDILEKYNNSFLPALSKAEIERIAENYSRDKPKAVEALTAALSALHDIHMNLLKSQIKVGGVLWAPSGAPMSSAQLFYDLQIPGESSASNILRSAIASCIIFGASDSVVSATMESEAWITHGGKQEDIHVLPDMGHTLGADDRYGPMAETSKRTLSTCIDNVASKLESIGHGFTSKYYLPIDKQN